MFPKFIFKLIKAINSNVSPKQLAWGFAFGSILGLTPTLSLHNLAVLLLAYIFNVNLPMVFAAAAIYKIIGILISNLSHLLGYFLLVDIKGLYGLWTILYNTPLVPWTRFYNTVVLGSFLIALVLFIPNYFIAKNLIILYRKNFQAKIQKLKFVQVLKSTSLFKLYDKYQTVKSEL